jgi:hypothetical protein
MFLLQRTCKIKLGLPTHLEVLDFIISAKAFLPCKVTQLQVLGIRKGMILGL